MKKIMFIVSVIILITGCKKGDDELNLNVVIKGKILSSQQSSSQSRIKSAYSLSDAAKVLVFSKYSGATTANLYDIVDGGFTAKGQEGTFISLIFLDKNNNYLGHLSTDNLDILPLTNLADGENTVIDLSTLTSDGDKIVPSHNPIGNEIQISDNDLNYLKSVDSYYEAIAKNIDTDNDGLPDILSNKQIIVYTWLFAHCGKWGINNTPPAINISSDAMYKMYLEGGDELSIDKNNFSLSGPSEQPYGNISLDWMKTPPEIQSGCSFISGFVNNEMEPFRAGTYALKINQTQTHNFIYSNIDMSHNFMVVVPTLKTNSSGKVTSITFQYQSSNGNNINPKSIISTLMVQFFDLNYSQFYKESDHMRLNSNSGFTEHTFSNPVDISNLAHLYINYEDILGNDYFVQWE